MRFCRCICVGALLVFATWLVGQAETAQAETKVTVERNHDDDATPKFKFKTIPGPASNDATGNNAASKAKFTIVDGNRDENGAEVDVLHDGKLPTEEDQPDRNFFFNAGEEGGRLAIDLGKTIDVKQVNTYSWHPNTRGPQVYKLYAADGSATDFKAEPKKDTDPLKCGWKLIASVDTRGSEGTGGQYGVSVSDSSGVIGKYRYLLFDISRTEADDDFGNTFFSQINVIAAEPSKSAKTAAAASGRLISRSPASAKYQITIDYTDAPELKDWVEAKLQPVSDEWYPKLIEALPSEGYSAPKDVFMAITNDYRGVAATGGNHVMCSAAWFKRNTTGEAAGAVVHELVHVVQQYHRVRGGSSNPGWLVEGIADYYRWFKYEPVPSGTRPRNPARANYTDSYRTTAGFLNYVVNKHDKELVVKFNAAMRQGKYSPDLWKEYTGKTPDELWKEYVATL